MTESSKIKLHNLNILSKSPLLTPAEVRERVPVSEKAAETVSQGREIVRNILDKKDPRLIVVVGPCSIHDYDLALEYASRLKKLSDEVSDSFFIIMRAYFEKPRTTVGWKGFINDPDLNNSFDVSEGLVKARRLLHEFAEMGLPAATEALDPIAPQFLGDLVSWTAIGARTTESQTHREMASGLSTPVGFKNGTDGNIMVALNAMSSASRSHRFIGVDKHGQIAIMETRGNQYAHIVLRGGNQPNYDSVSIKLCEKALEDEGLPQSIMVDCSHANSRKDHTLQPLIFSDCVKQIEEGNKSIIGLMLESHLEAGKQNVPDDLSNLKDLKYGVSITDACIDWATTEKIFKESNEKLKEVLKNRIS